MLTILIVTCVVVFLGSLAPKMRKTVLHMGGFTMKYIKGTGLYDEDHVNDYDANPYMSARSTMGWYYRMERLQTRNNLYARQATQSHNNNIGLHHSGRGAFDREAERRGIKVEKYSLTTTTGAARVAEMVLLRRDKLEEQSARLMALKRAELRRSSPSEWYDESKGPLNPNFLKSIQNNYDVNITGLPNTPLLRGST